MPDAGPGLTTERLYLRRFTEADLGLLERLQGDAEVMRHLGGTKTRDETASFLEERILDYYDRCPGLGIWATHERASGACVGFHLLNNIRGETHIQVGYCLFRQYWGFGYATEMGQALLGYGFTSLQLPRIVAITELTHTASQAVLRKCGLRRDGERSFAAYAGGAPMAWFERDRASWLAEHMPG